MFIFKSLFYSLAALKLSDQELAFFVLKNLPLKKLRCPSCGQTGHIRIISYYERDIIQARYGRPDYGRIRIPYLQCSCGASHAALPDVLIPFKSHTLRFILAVLSAYYSRPGGISVSKLCDCDRWDISPSTLYEWKKLFEVHYAQWCAACRMIIKLASDALSRVEGLPALPESFHTLFGRCFLQRCAKPSFFISNTLKPPSGSL